MFRVKNRAVPCDLIEIKSLVCIKRAPNMGRRQAKKQQEVLTTLSGNDLAERTTEGDTALEQVLDYIHSIEKQGEYFNRIRAMNGLAQSNVERLA